MALTKLPIGTKEECHPDLRMTSFHFDQDAHEQKEKEVRNWGYQRNPNDVALQTRGLRE